MTGRIANVDTGEIIAELSPDEARHLTDRIRDTVETVWALLLEAHERKAWAALGYTTWADYVEAEFDMSRRRSYQLLDVGRVTRAIGEITGDVQHVAQITSRDAEILKPHLSEVTDTIAERITSTSSPERLRELVSDVIDEHRTDIAAARQERDANAAWIESVNSRAPEGFDPAANRERLRLIGGLRRNTTDIAALPDPHDVVDQLMDHQLDIREPVLAALDWLTRFADDLDRRNLQ